MPVLRFLNHTQARIASLLLIGFCLQVSTGVQAVDPSYRRVYDASAHRYIYTRETTTWRQKVRHAWRNPVVKQSTIGAGVGLGTAVISGRSSALKGAGVGALVGAGTGLMDKSEFLRRHPYARTSLKGAAIGTGVGSITETSKVKGAAVGAASGAGFEAVRKFITKPSN